jgi:hypothetical protein
MADQKPQRTERDRDTRTHWPASRWTIYLASGLLALLAVASLPAVRGSAMSLFGGTSTIQRTLGDDLFYLLPNPPGVVVAVDGGALARLPAPGDTQPLRLAPGPHTLTWTSTIFPFAPLACRVSVPRAPGDTCPTVAPDDVPGALAGLSGTIIAMHDSLAALTPGSVSALTAAFTAALNAWHSSTSILPDETYFSGDGSGPVVAQTRMRATLHFAYVPTSAYPEPCLLTQQAIPCRFPGQDCTQLCTVAYPPATLAPSDEVWIAGALVSAAWDYTLPDGTPVAGDVGEPSSLQLATLRITCDASGWHVSVLIGHIPGLDMADDAVCDTTRLLLDQTHAWHALIDMPPSPSAVAMITLPNPADGCVALLTPQAAHATRAIFLGRLGVLRAVNAAAMTPADTLPQADVPEQALVSQGLARWGL